MWNKSVLEQRINKSPRAFSLGLSVILMKVNQAKAGNRAASPLRSLHLQNTYENTPMF